MGSLFLAGSLPLTMTCTAVPRTSVHERVLRCVLVTTFAGGSILVRAAARLASGSALVALILRRIDRLPVPFSVGGSTRQSARPAFPPTGITVGVLGRVFMTLRTMRFRPIRIAQRIPGASLRSHVLGVVASRTEEEMRRVTARGVVAVVEHAKPFGYGAIMQFPGDAMREQHRTGAWACPELTVAFVLRARRPLPTSGCEAYLCPESISQGSHSTGNLVVHGTQSQAGIP